MPRGIAREWADELADERQEIYTPDDGQPVVGSRRVIVQERITRQSL
jgi:hypothetical protein